MSGFDNHLTEMTLSEFQRICVSIGIDMVEHGPLATEMYWDGFCAAEVAEAVELIDLKEEFSYMEEHPYA
tara:strand:- start:648 stop:857 length:210 start_codon:yes stop_codon:yes gene_type:complete